jgi:hypothetical protein
MLTISALRSNISIGAGPLLIMELAYPQHRGRLAVMYNTLWYLGSIVAAWTVYGTIKYNNEASWRVPVGLQGLMPFIQLVAVYTLPESPRWLCSKDRPAEARQILVKVSSPTLQFMLSQELSISSTMPTGTRMTRSLMTSSTRFWARYSWKRLRRGPDGPSSSRRLGIASVCFSSFLRPSSVNALETDSCRTTCMIFSSR